MNNLRRGLAILFYTAKQGRDRGWPESFRRKVNKHSNVFLFGRVRYPSANGVRSLMKTSNSIDSQGRPLTTAITSFSNEQRPDNPNRPTTRKQSNAVVENSVAALMPTNYWGHQNVQIVRMSEHFGEGYVACLWMRLRSDLDQIVHNVTSHSNRF